MPNEVCERCFLYRSVEFCPECHNVPVVAQNLPVGPRLHQMWETWAALGASPKVIRILKEGYALPFQTSTNFLGSQAKQSVETYLGLQYTKQISKTGEIQNGKTRNYQDLPPNRRIGNIHRL